MKKRIYLAALMCAAFLSTQCTEDLLETNPEIEPEEEGTIVPEFYASTVSTRININEDGGSAWEKDDQLEVFINENIKKARPGRTLWKNHTFKIDPFNFMEGHFLAPVDAPKIFAQKSYNWYAINHQPDIKIGQTQTITFADQTSDGTNRHISNAEILWGKKESVLGKETPTITLQHLGTLMKFNIINSTDKAIVMKSVQFETPAGVYLSGQFSLDLMNGKMTAKKKECKTFISLALSKQPELAPGAAYEISLLVPPFALKAKDSFTVSTTTADGRTIVNKYSMRRDITFTAGTINTADVILQPAAKPVMPPYDPQDIPFADQAFREAIFTFGSTANGSADANGDGKISQEEADQIFMIDIPQEQGIVSLQGLENLHGLINLRIHNQSGLEEIDVTPMKGRLNELECDNNPKLKTIWAWPDLNSVYEMQGWSYASTVKIRRHTDNKEFIRGDQTAVPDQWR